MTTEVIRTRSAQTSAGRAANALIDCDVHQAPPTPAHLFGYMAPRWKQYLEAYGTRGPRETHYTQSGRGRAAARADAWPRQGVPGSDLDLMREQLLDRYGVTRALLGTTVQLEAGAQPLELGVAWTAAINDWTRAEWLDRDDRFLAAICAPFEHGLHAVREIERVASDRRFVTVLFNGRLERPLGNPKYWDVFEAAEAHDLPIEVHVAGIAGNLMTGVGIPAYYIEHHAGHVQDMQSHVISMVFEGVFERFPRLRVILVEGGFSWVGPLKWRLDGSWSLFRDEVPHLSRAPSEYVRDHFWFTTQPMEEPGGVGRLSRIIADGELEDRLLFATDYPHWDFDPPEAVLLEELDRDIERKIRSENARRILRTA